MSQLLCFVVSVWIASCLWFCVIFQGWTLGGWRSIFFIKGGITFFQCDGARVVIFVCWHFCRVRKQAQLSFQCGERAVTNTILAFDGWSVADWRDTPLTNILCELFFRSVRAVTELLGSSIQCMYAYKSVNWAKDFWKCKSTNAACERVLALGSSEKQLDHWRA